MPRLVSVAVPVPGLDLLTYSLPDDLDLPSPGVRVLVPLGTRVVTGCLVGEAAAPEGSRGHTQLNAVRPIVDVLDEQPYLPEEVLSVARWVADYYLAGAGETIAAAMPPGAWIESARAVVISPKGRAEIEAVERGGRRVTPSRRLVLGALADGRTLALAALSTRLRHALSDGDAVAALKTVRGLARDGLVTMTHTMSGRRSAHKTRRVVALTAQGHELAGASNDSPSDGSARGKARAGEAQRAAIALLAGAPEGLPAVELGTRGVSPHTLRRLAERGLISIRRERMERDPFEGLSIAGSPSDAPDQELTDEQRSAFDQLSRAGASRNVSRGAAARGDRERQDRAVRSSRRRRQSHRPFGADTGSGNCADASDCAGVSPEVRDASRDSAQRVVERRAP